MHKILSIISIMGLTCGAFAQETNRFDRFEADNGVFYAFVEAPVAMMQTEIPEGVEYGTIEVSPAIYDESGTNLLSAAVTRQKTMAEFVVLVRTSLDETTALMLIAPSQDNSGRNTPMDKGGLAALDPWMTELGFGVDTWLDKVAYKALLATPAYTITEE